MANVGTLWEWVEPTPMRVISVSPLVATGGGGSGGSNVTVPGNAEDILTRAAGAIFTVEEVDDDNVTLILPAFLDSEDDIDTLSSQLMYVFGPVSGDELGWLTVTAKGILGLADSSDVGGDPDSIPVTGTVTLTPGISRPIRIISTGQFLAVAPVVVDFDEDGELAYDGIKTVHLIAPQWTDLSNTTWSWTADVRPGPGQTWQPFSVSFTGAPGDTVNLASLV